MASDELENLAEIDKAAAKVLQGYDWSLVSNNKKFVHQYFFLSNMLLDITLNLCAKLLSFWHVVLHWF